MLVPMLHRSLLIVLLLPLLVGCANSMSLADANTPNSSSLKQQSQGIRGTVVRLSGNQMPTVGDDTTRTNPPQPVQTTIWVFSGRIPSNSSPKWSVKEASQHANLLNKVTSDSEGNFFVELSPGEYTIFAEYDSNLYLNSFLGDGSYEPVQVNEGKITEINLVNTEDAFF